MTKKILALLTASLLLLCVVACNKETGKETDTLAPFGSETDETLDESVSGGTSTETETETSVPDEINPVFKDVSLKVVVLAANANVRSTPSLSGDNVVAWPTENVELTVTGESEQWYRISHGGEVRYIRKSIVGPASALEGYTPISDTVEVSTNANIRSYPLVDENNYTKRASVKAGTKLERVAVGAEWSIVKFTVEVEDESGVKTQVEKEYYISNSCLVSEPDAIGSGDEA